jgi:hypothetical protein
MKIMLLAAVGAFAAGALTAPAAAEQGGFGGRGGDFVGVPAGTLSVRNGFRHDCVGFNGECRGQRNRGGRGDVVLDWYGGEWALYNNRSWEPDSYNDWWHDRPDRAYPAWMRRNENCDRRWFSGDTLRC